VYLGHDDGAIYLERPVDLVRYSNTFEMLVEAALSPDATRDFRPDGGHRSARQLER
jgi:hypothetical protein